jgi:hypothetical protein
LPGFCGIFGQNEAETSGREAFRNPPGLGCGYKPRPRNRAMSLEAVSLLCFIKVSPLYIDKSMRDHGLFRAICRVYRLDGEEKDSCYIVDYKQLFGGLTDALNKYTSGAFEGYDEEDVKGLIKDRLEEARNYLDKTLEELDDICEGVNPPREEIDYIISAVKMESI